MTQNCFREADALSASQQISRTLEPECSFPYSQQPTYPSSHFYKDLNQSLYFTFTAFDVLRGPNVKFNLNLRQFVAVSMDTLSLSHLLPCFVVA